MQLQSALLPYVSRYDTAQIFVLCDSKVVCPLMYPTLTIEATETNKSLETATLVWNWLTKQGATRKALLINVGGGVICDLGGFVAATYLRGIDYINIPTTLLAMVDAAVGGKTGVNLGFRTQDTEQRAPDIEHRTILLKNRVGVFYLPVATVIDPEFLKTLPTEELLSGFGEVIKTALLRGEQAFAEALGALEAFAATGIVSRELIEGCKQYKEQVVAEDPKEAGRRKMLNFGHTVGHAIEEHRPAAPDRVQTASLTEPKPLHGYCVLWGLVAEVYLSVVLAECPKAILQQLTKVMLDYYGRPSCNCKEQEELIDLMRQDKKNDSGDAINFTLLQKAGDPIINQVAEPEVIKEALDYLFSI